MPFEKGKIPKGAKPFKKGESGNPTGKPKGVEHSSTRLKRLLELTQDLKNPVTGETESFSVAEQMDLALIIKARKGDVLAYREILDRLEGKAKQSTDITTDGESLNKGFIDFLKQTSGKK
jgi:2-oxoglutarate dehydrogenase complex dehydrogenase (E1) component-like enzyme